jgi:hypothetical protein
MAAIFTARFKSACAHCDEPIYPEQVALTNDGETTHIKCPLLYVYAPNRNACPSCNLLHGTAQKECDDY